MAESDRINPNPFGPNLPVELLSFEKTWLHGALMSSIGFGAVTVVAFMCCRLLLQDRAREQNKKRTILLFIYVLILFSLSLLFQACNSWFTQAAYIDNREYPEGGPAGYENDFWNVPVNTAGNVAFVLANWMTDGILLWRFAIIFRQSAFPFWATMTLPFLMYLGSIALGSLFIVQMAATNIFEASGINWTLPYLCLSLSTNIVLTLSIVTRLFLFRWRIGKALGSQHGSQYTSVASMIVESAAFHSIMSLLFLIPFGLEHPIATTFLQTLMPDQVFSSLLIILRVAQGRAWSANTHTAVMQLNTGGDSTTGSSAIPMSAIQFRVGGAKASLSSSRTQTIAQQVIDSTTVEDETDPEIKSKGFSGV